MDPPWVPQTPFSATLGSLARQFTGPAPPGGPSRRHGIGKNSGGGPE